MNNIYDFNLGSLVQVLDYRKFDLMKIETDLKNHYISNGSIHGENKLVSTK